MHRLLNFQSLQPKYRKRMTRSGCQMNKGPAATSFSCLLKRITQPTARPDCKVLRRKPGLYFSPMQFAFKSAFKSAKSVLVQRETKATEHEQRRNWVVRPVTKVNYIAKVTAKGSGDVPFACQLSDGALAFCLLLAARCSLGSRAENVIFTLQLLVHKGRRMLIRNAVLSVAYHTPSARFWH